MKLNVVGQNVIISGDFGKMTKKIADKVERDKLIAKVKDAVKVIESKASDAKKELKRESIIALFNKESSNAKVKAKVESKVEKNKEIVAVNEIKTKKKEVKTKTKKIKEVVESKDDVAKEELKKDLVKENEKKNETPVENRSGRESGNNNYSSYRSW